MNLWHAMFFRENNYGKSKLGCKSKQAHKSELVNVINIFHDVDSTLYTVNNIHPKVITVIRSENLALFTVTRIHRIRKSAKNRNSETRWNVTEDPRLNYNRVGLIFLKCCRENLSFHNLMLGE